MDDWFDTSIDESLEDFAGNTQQDFAGKHIVYKNLKNRCTLLVKAYFLSKVLDAVY